MKAFQNLQIVGTANASSDHVKTLVVGILSGISKTFAESLIQDLGADLKSLPAEEKRPGNTDILMILGKAQ